MISIIGMGTAGDMLTIKALDKMKQADILIGAARMIDSCEKNFEIAGKEIYREYEPKKIQEIVEACKEKKIVIFVSGDTGFYSLTDALVKCFAECEVIPGISSVSSFFAKIKMPWQDAALRSEHGRDSNMVEMVRRNQKTFVLTGNNIDTIADRLIAAGYAHLTVYVGSNLDTTSEQIELTTIEKLKDKNYPALTVLLIVNPEADASVRIGIPDEEFVRGEVPMTKAEVRAVIMSKLGIHPGDTCLDIGAGTGSVTVEMAYMAWQGKVIAIEKRCEAVALIQENIKKFHIGNTTVLCGEATDILQKEVLPVSDVAFIGGSDGKLEEIIKQLRKLNPHMRIVVSAIALETLSLALQVLQNLGMQTEVVQFSVAKSRDVAGYHLMMANNPIYIIKGI